MYDALRTFTTFTFRDESVAVKVPHGEPREAEQVCLGSSEFISFADISGVTTKVEQRGTFSRTPPSSVS